jgi:hypothetical protein
MPAGIPIAKDIDLPVSCHTPYINFVDINRSIYM